MDREMNAEPRLVPEALAKARVTTDRTDAWDERMQNPALSSQQPDGSFKAMDRVDAKATKRPVAFRIPTNAPGAYIVTASETEAQHIAENRGVDYEGLYLVADRTDAKAPDGEVAGLVESLLRNARDCENDSRWAVPELAPLLDKAATALTRLQSELATATKRAVVVRWETIGEQNIPNHSAFIGNICFGMITSTGVDRKTGEERWRANGRDGTSLCHHVPEPLARSAVETAALRAICGGE